MTRKNNIERDYPTTSSYSQKYSKREAYLSKTKHEVSREKEREKEKNKEKEKDP